MSNLANLEFVALDISGNNYLRWTLDAEIHLSAKGLGETIKVSNTTSPQDQAKAMIFLRHHLHEDLKTEYLTIKEPHVLWQSLKERFDHQKAVILPKARYDWLHLRLQDFKTVSEYNSAMFKITSQLKLCGDKVTEEEMLEKTFSTFHASNMVLQQQYRERGFKKYSELISCLLVAEQNNELLMKNHQTRPTGSEPFPEANGVFQANATFDIGGRGRGRGHGRGRGRGSGRGRGRGHNHAYGYRRGRGGRQNYGRGNNHGYKKQPNHDKGKDVQTNGPQNVEGNCNRCGAKGHWARACRTPRHLVDLYQASQSKKMKSVEANLAEFDGDTHLDVSDFFENNDIEHLIGDGTVHHD